MIEFQYRQGQLLNMRSEKMTKTMLYEAVTTVIRRRGEKIHLVDYTCAESTLLEFLLGSLGTSVQQYGLVDFGSGVKPFYVIFIETEGLQRNAAESEALAEEVITRASLFFSPITVVRPVHIFECKKKNSRINGEKRGRPQLISRELGLLLLLLLQL